jgi:acetyl-CoA carboxylase biotin carboxyl carrier protein
VDINLDELIALVELLKDADFSEFKYEKGDLRIVIRRGSPSDDEDQPKSTTEGTRERVAKGQRGDDKAVAPAAARTLSSAAAVKVPQGAVPVPSPLLGTFYARPKPGEAPFVSVGSKVEPDTVLCIVEVMKLMNSVVAGVCGVVAAVHANEGELVEHGQLLFSITPLAE